MDIVKLYHTVKYIRPSQLIARINLSLKRKIREKNPDYFNKNFRNLTVNPVLKDVLSKPVFPAREGYFKCFDNNTRAFTLKFHNKSQAFYRPINWHKKELEHGTRLWKLHLHYMEFLEEADDDWFEYLIHDWINANLPYKKEYWLDSWNSFALSIRVVVWMQQIAWRKENLSKSFIKKVSNSIYKQILFLEQNIENDVKGNHLIKNIKALFWASSFFGSDENVKRWRRLGMRLLQQEMKEQILEDGMHYERSPAYHCQVLADFLEIHSVLINQDIQKILVKKLEKMGKALEMLTHPDGKISLYNDGGLDMTYSPQILLEKLTSQINYVEQEPIQTKLPKAGYWGLKKGDSFLLFDAGKIAPDYLPAHGHGDIFSFEWSIDNMRFFIDKGVYEYNEGVRRSESRATSSHNTVTIGGEDQCEFWKSFRVARRAKVDIKKIRISDDFFLLHASHDGFKRLRGHPIHERKIEFDGAKVLIEDETKGGANQKVSAHFLLHPKVRLEPIKNGYNLCRDDKTLRISTKHKIKTQNSRWFPNFGREIACKKLVILYGNAPCNGKIKIECIT